MTKTYFNLHKILLKLGCITTGSAFT